jgi:pyrimidine operon attenuation protein/uracil phosphoribosyltransferase
MAEIILDEKNIGRALTRIAREIVAHNGGAESLGIIGILTRGAVLARRIATIIHDGENVKVPVGLMDIGLYRDDVHSKLDQPTVQQADVLFEVKNRNIILVDDVLFTGRTVRAALDQIIDFGRPRTIQLAVLVDRGHRELPISADYVGISIPTEKDDRIVLEVKGRDGVDRLSIVRGIQGKPKPAAKKRAASKSKRRKKK